MDIRSDCRPAQRHALHPTGIGTVGAPSSPTPFEAFHTGTASIIAAAMTVTFSLAHADPGGLATSTLVALRSQHGKPRAE